MATDDYRTGLRHEFEAGEGSFLLQLRCEGRWDPEAFSRLIALMEMCCKDQEQNDTLERWMANGFWYCSVFIENQAKRSGMRLVHEPKYYEDAYGRIADLAYWFFYGQPPWL